MASSDTNASVWAFRNTQVTQSGGGGGGVARLLAGPNISLNPINGLGEVTVSASGGGTVGPVLNNISGINAPLNTNLKIEANSVYVGSPAPSLTLSGGGSDNKIVINDPAATSQGIGVYMSDSGTALTILQGFIDMKGNRVQGCGYIDGNSETNYVAFDDATANNGLRLGSDTDTLITASDNIFVGEGVRIRVTNSGLTRGISIDANDSPLIVSCSTAQFGGSGIYVFSAPVQIQNTLAVVCDGGEFAGFFQELPSDPGSPIRQPVIQYGSASGLNGASGTTSVTLPKAYSNVASYVIQVTMQDAPAAQLYATPSSGVPDVFTIGWQSAGAGPHTIMWTTFGT